MCWAPGGSHERDSQVTLLMVMEVARGITYVKLPRDLVPHIFARGEQMLAV